MQRLLDKAAVSALVWRDWSAFTWTWESFSIPCTSGLLEWTKQEGERYLTEISQPFLKWAALLPKHPWQPGFVN